MPDTRQQVGKTGESLAEQYLRGRGYRILARNARSPSGELDLIAEDGDVVVFVEVKARQTAAFGGAAYAVDPKKQARIVRQAAQYLARHRLQHRFCRFDVVLVHSQAGRDPVVELIQNAFEVPDGHLLS